MTNFPVSRPESLGFSGARLAHIDQYLQQRYIETGKLPCAETLIARRGEVIHHSRLGMMDLERKLPLAENTLFRIFSMTKPITSVAFMMLVEEGLVALDDPVHRYIPKWKDLTVYVGGELGSFQTQPVARPMQVIDLLRHTSGLTYGIQHSTPVDAAYRQLKLCELMNCPNLEDTIEALGKLPLEFSPGTGWNYSVATDVLAYLIGKISGMPFEQFIQQRILSPLKMNDTSFMVPADKVSRFVACYQVTAEQRLKLQDDPKTSLFAKPPIYASGNAGLISTAADYLHFTQMVLNGGELNGMRLLSPKTIQLMTANHLPNNCDLPSLSRSLFSETTYNGVGFGLGFAVTVDQTQTMILGSNGEYFWGGLATTGFWIDPVEEIVGIFLTQVMPSSTYAVRRELRTLTYAAMTESYATIIR